MTQQCEAWCCARHLFMVSLLQCSNLCKQHTIANKNMLKPYTVIRNLFFYEPDRNQFFNESDDQFLVNAANCNQLTKDCNHKDRYLSLWGWVETIWAVKNCVVKITRGNGHQARSFLLLNWLSWVASNTPRSYWS